jgi:hypothetical protein
VSLQVNAQNHVLSAAWLQNHRVWETLYFATIGVSPSVRYALLFGDRSSPPHPRATYTASRRSRDEARRYEHVGFHHERVEVERQRATTSEFTGDPEREREGPFPRREVASVDSFGGEHPGGYTEGGEATQPTTSYG